MPGFNDGFLHRNRAAVGTFFGTAASVLEVQGVNAQLTRMAGTPVLNGGQAEMELPCHTSQ